jgi:hypothetical protein
LRFAVAQELLVKTDRGADIPLFLEALGLPHLGGQAGELLSITLVEGFELIEGSLQVLRPVGGIRRKGVRQLIIGDPLLKHRIEVRGQDHVALGAARVALGHGDRECLVGGGEGLDRLAIGVVGLRVGGSGVGQLRFFLGLVLGILALEHRQVAAFEEQLGQLHEGIARLGARGIGFGEPLELVARVLQEFLAQDQVARSRRLIDQGPSFLIVEPDLEFVRQSGIGAELVDVIQGEVMEAVVLEFLEEAGGRPGILGGMGRRGGRDQANDA